MSSRLSPNHLELTNKSPCKISPMKWDGRAAWSKALGMSSALYLVAVTGDLAVVLAGRLRVGP